MTNLTKILYIELPQLNGTHQIAVSDALHQVAIGGQWSYVHGIYQRMFAKFSAP